MSKVTQPSLNEAIRPFQIVKVPDTELAELRRRISATKWPEAELASDAFDVVIPSLPGYGFSAKPKTTGWGAARIARAWVQLMKRLGYNQFLRRVVIGAR